MKHYVPRRLRPWALPALAVRTLIYILGHWPLALVAALIISPVGPHLRIQYSYFDYGGGLRSMTECDYFGSRGMVKYRFGSQCPIVAIIDTRDVQ